MLFLTGQLQYHIWGKKPSAIAIRERPEGALGQLEGGTVPLSSAASRPSLGAGCCRALQRYWVKDSLVPFEGSPHNPHSLSRAPEGQGLSPSQEEDTVFGQGLEGGSLYLCQGDCVCSETVRQLCPAASPATPRHSQGIKAFREEENGLWLGLVPAYSQDMAVEVQNAPEQGAGMCSRSEEQW